MSRYSTSTKVCKRSKRFKDYREGKMGKKHLTNLYPGRAFHEAQFIRIGPKTVKGTTLARKQWHPEIALIRAAETKGFNATIERKG